LLIVNIIKMKHTVLLFVVVLIVLTSCHKTNGSLEGKIEGKVKRETLSIAPKVAGRILECRVKEGDNVKVGDTLAIIDVPEIEAKRLQAEGAFIAAKAQYKMAKNGATSFERQQMNAKLEAARQQLQLAEKSYKRINSMVKDSLVPMQKYDEVFEKYSSAKAQFDAVAAQKADVDYGVRNEKIEMALGDTKRAEGALLEAQTAYNERYIIATRTMTIETVDLKNGELALPGYNIFVGYDIDGTYFRFTVPESKLANYVVGKSYKVEVVSQNKVVDSKLVYCKSLPAYADKSSSYANYQPGESLYELKLVPNNLSDKTSLNANMVAYLVQ
jgi:HlyD family secretion protein